MDIAFVTLKYKDLSIKARDSEKIRGYFGRKYIDNDLFHNHGKINLIYRYPLVQYKTINNIPIIIGIREAMKPVLDIAFDETTINISNEIYEINDIDIKKEIKEIGISNELVKYRFISPWIALNQENYKRYSNGDLIEKEEIINKILIGNFMSFSKSMGYDVKDRIKVKSILKEKKVNFKNRSMIGFTGEFYINYNIPNYFGIGKSVAKGFGCLERIG